MVWSQSAFFAQWRAIKVYDVFSSLQFCRPQAVPWVRHLCLPWRRPGRRLRCKLKNSSSILIMVQNNSQKSNGLFYEKKLHLALWYFLSSCQFAFVKKVFACLDNLRKCFGKYSTKNILFERLFCQLNSEQQQYKTNEYLWNISLFINNDAYDQDSHHAFMHKLKILYGVTMAFNRVSSSVDRSPV